MKEAVSKYVKDDDIIYLAGFTHMIPFAAGHEIIRQKRRNMTLCRATPDIIYDQMIAAGCCKKAMFSYAGNPGVGSLRCFRRALEKGQPNKIEIEEYTHFGLSGRLYAGATNMPFLPMRTNLGSDLPAQNPNMKTIKDPYSGDEVSIVPPLKPDLAVVHVQRCDIEGNSHIWGIIGEQKDAAFASKKVIISTEDIVDESVIRSDPNRTVIPDFVVHAVVHEPWCAHPSYTQGYYDRDNEFYMQWDEITKEHDTTLKYLDEWVFGVEDRAAYMKKISAEKLLKLKPKAAYCTPVDYGTL
ncbi:MAG: CoA transferase subunit A [Candidatus Thermoplasmatota archaeon]|nr:CoA transferase subunit A [Candidatus Thermoplasmatota archaeon]MBU1914765.1 CoA transferase subunit A [Candidatus Thermoplasmatota archaeon]